MTHRPFVPTALRRALARFGSAPLAVGLGLALALPAAGQDFEIACPLPAEREVVDLVNDERASRGLAPLALDVRLGAAALRHSEDMAAGCFLSHTGSDGSVPGARVFEAGYGFYAGEVAGAGQNTPAGIVAGWLASPGHEGLLMQPGATHIGVGHEARPACGLVGYGFLVSDFWTANLGADLAPAFGEDDHCGDDPATPACRDGLDNDGDGLVDHDEDDGCGGPDDPTEQHACGDGLDNDGDGHVDFPADAGCLSADQRSEDDSSCGIGFEVAFILPPLMRLRRRRLGRPRA